MGTALGVIGDLFDDATTAKSVVEHYQAAARGEFAGYAGLAADAISIAAGAVSIATPIIAGGLQAIAAMAWTCGSPGTSPEPGAKFLEGSDQLTALKDSFESASPTESWEGKASNTYDRQNTKQAKRVADMAKVDAAVSAIVTEQAKQVFEAKAVLDASSTALTYMIPVALAANAIPVPPAGQAAQKAIEIGAVLGSVPRCVLTMDSLVLHTLDNAQKLQEKLAEYERIAASAKPLGDGAKPRPHGGSRNPNIPGDGPIGSPPWLPQDRVPKKYHLETSEQHHWKEGPVPEEEPPLGTDCWPFPRHETAPEIIWHDTSTPAQSPGIVPQGRIPTGATMHENPAPRRRPGFVPERTPSEVVYSSEVSAPTGTGAGAGAAHAGERAPVHTETNSAPQPAVTLETGRS